ncbi:amphi-Trp domain-containing protein [Pseudodesulfovibrio cashew]|uniref:Amphi-Trp domain-containing protein n=1 Tax=Pseudodesulfovibrio cashew TaxID=2678688 RepID=A0A6I6JC69_9BACT|nr:amphi-Trp domain-containing protein [Pseudodesulfovibrio cashew]QGY38640.1 amphi-Trp domain-containing protein [Pseudodesulfovibrio cashew]
MSEEKFVFDSLQDTDTIKDFLVSLTDGFERESITLSTNGDTIELNPNGLLSFTVKAKRKGAENKLSIKISWKDAAGEKPAEEASLKVS